MIQGTVTTDGVPTVSLTVAGRTWPATIDTGFNGDLELPEGLRSFVNARFIAPTEWVLAGGQRSVEDTYEVEFPFDGLLLAAEATFVSGDSILIGTGMMTQYRLTIDFVATTVLLERRA
jgi:predicted aspartyl protease